MAVMTDVLIPALHDAREAHAAVVDRFRTDATITPPGAQRQELERQVADAELTLERIDDRVREVQPHGLLAGTTQIVQVMTRGLLRATTLPLEIGASVAAEVLRGRHPANEHRLLKNAEDEYAAAARALAACRAGESIAEQLQDQATAELLATLRREDEQLLETLEDSVVRRARDVAAATDGHRPPRAEGAEGEGLPDAVGRVMRITLDRLGAALQTGGRRVRATAEGAVREMPHATRMAEEVQGAVTREHELPIPGFSQLSVTEIQERLRTLSQSELTVIEGYERAHAGRPGVLNVIQRLRDAEPWTAYDTMSADQICARLENVPAGEARQVLDYERRHRQRSTVISAAETRVPM